MGWHPANSPGYACPTVMPDVERNDSPASAAPASPRHEQPILFEPLAGESVFSSPGPSPFDRVWRNRGVFAVVVGAVTLASVIYTWLVPPVWEARATLIFPTRSPSILGLSGLFNDQVTVASALGGGPTPLKIFSGILTSESTIDFVAKQTGLERKKIRDMRDLEEQTPQSTLTIKVRDEDSKLAQRVISLHLQAMRDINNRVSTTVSEDDSEVLFRRLQQERQELQTADARVLEFQKKALTAPTVVQSGGGKDAAIIASPAKWSQQLRELEIELERLNRTQSYVTAQATTDASDQGDRPSYLPPIKKWRSRLVDLEYELRLKRLALSSSAPEVIRLERQIAVTRDQMQRELKTYMSAVAAGTVDPQGDDASYLQYLGRKTGLEAQINAVGRLAQLAPIEASTLSRLTREAAAQSIVVQQLQAQYETARVQKDRNPNRWDVLDAPRIMDKPVNKGLVKAAAVGVFAGLPLAVIAALFADRRRSRRRLLAIP